MPLSGWLHGDDRGTLRRALLIAGFALDMDSSDILHGGAPRAAERGLFLEQLPICRIGQ